MPELIWSLGPIRKNSKALHRGISLVLEQEKSLEILGVEQLRPERELWAVTDGISSGKIGFRHLFRC
jgi:hypothetical protein